MDKATPLRSNGSSSASAIQEDVASLISGRPEIRNLQRIALFSQSHPISAVEAFDGDEDLEGREIWEEGRLFDRTFHGLMNFLTPETVCIIDPGRICTNGFDRMGNCLNKAW
jgi:CLIP-associating protein 1/2